MPTHQDFYTFAVASKASDIHLSSGEAPMIRIDGRLCPTDFSVLSSDNIQEILKAMITQEMYARFEAHWEIDFSWKMSNNMRFRVSAFRKSMGIGIVLRIIPEHILSLTDLHMPKIIQEIALLPQGLVLVTGATGSGKSTTLAAIVDHINQHTQGHIITIEDPIEFIHQNKQCLITQRELHRDTHTFSHALRSALRADPNVILVGELRDLETIRLAITAAETGHLVLATLHTLSAEKTIHRIIDVFPGNEKNTIRAMLSESLAAVIAQTLMPCVTGGRIAAVEIMRVTPAIRHLIREDKIAHMVSVMQTGQAMGMQTMEQHIAQLSRQGMVAC